MVFVTRRVPRKANVMRAMKALIDLSCCFKKNHLSCEVVSENLSLATSEKMGAPTRGSGRVQSLRCYAHLWSSGYDVSLTR